jgi:gas vesicle protein
MPEVAERAQQAQGAAQEQVQEKAEQAKGKLREQVDTRSTEIGQQVSGTGEAVREAARSLREKGQDQPAQAVEQAADKMEQAGRWLTEADGDRILSDVEDFARRQPWAVLAGGLVLGFAASRFLKSSSQQRYSSRTTGVGQLPQGTPVAGSAPGGGGNGSF